MRSGSLKYEKLYGLSAGSENRNVKERLPFEAVKRYEALLQLICFLRLRGKNVLCKASQ